MSKTDKKHTYFPKKRAAKETFQNAISKKTRPQVLSGGDAHKFLNISRQRFEFLVQDYEIPFQPTSAGKIFFLEDIEEFQKARKSKMKHGLKKKRKKTN